MSFDRLAPHYRWMEFVLAGEKLQRCRTAFLPEVADARDILILGEGNGRFLIECRKVLPKARITCIDESGRMLQLARLRLNRSRLGTQEINFVNTDALSWAPAQRSFDLIVTHFFLDCFRADQLKRLLSVLVQACRPHAGWLLADFQIPDRGVSRPRAQVIHWLMYSFFRITTRLSARKLTPPDSFLTANGFALQKRKISDWGLLHSDLWEKTPNRHAQSNHQNQSLNTLNTLQLTT
jgi:ubiquinone/menaquinone biosynthesis C-methylase UbiE